MAETSPKTLKTILETIREQAPLRGYARYARAAAIKSRTAGL